MEFSREVDSFNEFANLDPESPIIISIFGKKDSGKSVWARSVYTSFDGDKLGVDVHGDMDPGDDAIEIKTPLPDYFPSASDGTARNLVYYPDPGSPTYREDLDKSIGLALFPKKNRTLLWLDEIGEFCTANNTGPNLRRLLQQSRHHNTSLLACGPRPTDIDPLIYSQSDLVVVYEMPNEDDQIKLAKTIGYPVKRFQEAMIERRRLGRHHHLIFANAKNTLSGMAELALCDPLEL